MDNLLRVSLEAHNSELNHHRRYEITVGSDLFGDWTVAIRYGRTGQIGRIEQVAGADAAYLHGIVKERLRRRLSAPKRIGCSYRLKEVSAVAGFDVNLWLPSDVMRQLVN